MNLKSLSEMELVGIRDDLQKLHTGSSSKDLIVGECRPEGTLDENKPWIVLQDKRLSNLLWTLFCEVHNELCERFTSPILVPNEDSEYPR